MICSIVMSYTLLFVDGTAKHRVKYLDVVTAQNYIERLTDREFLKNSEIKEVRNILVDVHPKSFDCKAGPTS